MITKYSIMKYVNRNINGSIITYFGKRPYLSKRSICFIIYDFSKDTDDLYQIKSVVFSEILKYDKRKIDDKIRIDGDTFEEVEFLSLLKAKELGWYIKKETIFGKKNIIEKKYD